MRRLLSILLLLAAGLPMAAPLLALSGDADSHLPACCRRNGAHRCFLLGAQAQGSGWAAPMRCPLYPSSVAPVRHKDHALTAAVYGDAVAAYSAAISGDVATRGLRVLQGARLMRGPPALLA